MLNMEETATCVRLNNMALSDFVESQNTLVGDLNDRVAVIKEYRVVLKAALIQLQREIRGHPPGHANVAEDLEASRLYISSKGEVEADLRMELEVETERRVVIEAESRNGEDMAEEALI